MLRLRGLLYFQLITLAVLIYSLFILKYDVIDESKKLAAINNQIISDHESISVLKAEYAYLSSPTRLTKLANKYLKLKPITMAQVQNFKKAKLQIKIANNKRSANNKWRYKEITNPDIKTVSLRK